MPLSQCSCEGCELKTLFFEKVSTLEIESMCTRKIEKSYKKGEIIIGEGSEIKEFLYLKQGLVKLLRGEGNEKEQIICFAGPLDFVSLLSIFTNTHYNYSVIALEDSVTCSIDLAEVKSIASQNGAFAMGIIEKISKATDNIIQTFLEVKHRRLYGRIAYILLYFSDKVYKGNTFDLPVSRKEMAEFIGMTTENVIRTLSEFRKDGIIRIYGKTIEIIDFERLRSINEHS
jgi:CRP-like cAMP-binding protein